MQGGCAGSSGAAGLGGASPALQAMQSLCLSSSGVSPGSLAFHVCLGSPLAHNLPDKNTGIKATVVPPPQALLSIVEMYLYVSNKLRSGRCIMKGF